MQCLSQHFPCYFKRVFSINGRPGVGGGVMYSWQKSLGNYIATSRYVQKVSCHVIPPLPEIANFSMKYLKLSKVYTDEDGIKYGFVRLYRRSSTH